MRSSSAPTTERSTVSAARPAPPAGDAVAEQARRDGVDIDAVRQAASHRVVAEGSGTLVSVDDRYRATFDAAGFEVGSPGGAEGGALRVTTTRIEVGATEAAVAAGPWRADANVAERSLGLDVVERVTATDGQVEWDVVLATRPAGTGDLRVDADVVGAAGSPGRRADGLRWQLEGGGSVVMGELVVKDRAGAELYRAMPEADRTRVSLVVPSEVLRDAAYPVTVDPTVGPEWPVADVGPERFPATTASYPALAFDGTNYLVAWTDGRKWAGDGDAQIFAARVARDGTVLDDVGIRLSDGATPNSGPSVGFDGTNFLVVWSQEGYRDEPGIFGNRVSPAGEVLDGSGFLIDADADADVMAFDPPRLAFDGTNYLVVWTGAYAKRVSPTGTVLDAEPIALSTRRSDRRDVAVSFDGTDYLAVWTDSAPDGSGAGDVYGTRVSPAGTVLDPAGIAIAAGPGPESNPALGFDGTNHLVVWNGDPPLPAPGAGLDIYGARVSPAGAVLDPDGFPIATEPTDQTQPAIAFDGTDYLVVWGDNGMYAGLFGARVSPAGAVSASVRSTYGSGPVGLAFDGTNHLVVSSSDFFARTVYGIHVRPDGSPIEYDRFVLSTRAPDQTDPAVGFDGTNYLVVWSDDRYPGLYGARVSRSGRMLDGSGFPVGAGSDPQIAFDGTNFLVVSEPPDPYSSVTAVRVSPDGIVLDPYPFNVSGAGASQPAMAFDGVDFVVTWLQEAEFCGCGTGYYVILAARVSPTGQVTSSNTPIAQDLSYYSGPAIASDGTNSLVVWTDPRANSESRDVYGSRVDRSLRVLDGTGIPISTRPGYEYEPSVAFDGTRYLVVWTDSRSTPDGDYDIYGARVGRSGVVRDPNGIAVSTAPGTQEGPSVAANGRFFVVWRNRPSGGAFKDVYGTRVSGAGEVFDRDGVPIATDASWKVAPTVIAGPGSRFTVAYQRYAELPATSQRVFLRTVAPK